MAHFTPYSPVIDRSGWAQCNGYRESGETSPSAGDDDTDAPTDFRSEVSEQEDYDATRDMVATIENSPSDYAYVILFYALVIAALWGYFPSAIGGLLLVWSAANMYRTFSKSTTYTARAKSSEPLELRMWSPNSSGVLFLTMCSPLHAFSLCWDGPPSPKTLAKLLGCTLLMGLLWWQHNRRQRRCRKAFAERLRVVSDSLGLEQHPLTKNDHLARPQGQ